MEVVIKLPAGGRKFRLCKIWICSAFRGAWMIWQAPGGLEEEFPPSGASQNFRGAEL